jgi:hypothetical protein
VRLRFLSAYLGLVLTAVLSLTLFAAQLYPRTQTQAAAALLARYGRCVQTVAGPTKLYACSNDHAYVIQNGDQVVDVGLLSTGSPIPLG